MLNIPNHAKALIENVEVIKCQNFASKDITICITSVNHTLPDLKIRTDDAYLLRFLRAKKFDYDRAFNLVLKHFEMKADEKNKQLFNDLRPSTVTHVLEAGVTGVLPHRDKQGRRVMIFRPGNTTGT